MRLTDPRWGNAVYVVEGGIYYDKACAYDKRWPTFELALFDFLRLLRKGEFEDLALRVSTS